MPDEKSVALEYEGTTTCSSVILSPECECTPNNDEGWEKYDHCMSLIVNQGRNVVDLVLETELDHYLDWIKGEGADIGLFRCRETKRVVGVCLPLLRNNLTIHHDGPIRINSGFKLENIP